MKSRISVALCTYNGEHVLATQLASIAAQTVQPEELVICDDGSTDGTAAIVEQFASRVAFKIVFERNLQNLGSTKNFEKAMGLCTGTHIALCDQDDMWYPHKLKTLLNVFTRSPGLGGVFSDGDIADEQLNLSGGTLWSSFRFTPSYRRRFRKDPQSILLTMPVVTGATLMVDASQREHFGTIPPSWVHDAWITWMLAIYSRLDFVAESLIRYRAHPKQQIGIPPSSIRAQIALLRSTAVADLKKDARRYEDLYRVLGTDGGGDAKALLPRIREKIEHDYRCASLPADRLARWWDIARRWRSYRKYSFGMRSMARDVVL